MILNKINGWIKEIIGEEKQHEMLTQNEDNKHTSFFFEEIEQEESYESDLEDYILPLEGDEDDDIENIQYHTTPKEARRAFVQTCIEFIEASTCREVLYDTDLLIGTIKSNHLVLLPVDHPIVNMLMQDSDMHPGEETYDPIDEINIIDGTSTLYIYSWDAVKMAIYAIQEMFVEFDKKLDKTWVIPYPVKDEEVEHLEEDINIIIEEV